MWDRGNTRKQLEIYEEEEGSRGEGCESLLLELVARTGLPVQGEAEASQESSRQT